MIQRGTGQLILYDIFSFVLYFLLIHDIGEFFRLING